MRFPKRVRRRGTAAVEMALVLPLFLILLSGLWEVGRVAEIEQILNNAAREGGRQASTGLVTNSAIRTIVLNNLQYSLNDGDFTGNTGRTRALNAVVTITDLTNTGTDVSNATQLDKIQITVTVPFKDVRWINLPLVTTSSTNLTGQTFWYSMADKAYPSTISPPLGN